MRLAVDHSPSAIDAISGRVSIYVGSFAACLLDETEAANFSAYRDAPFAILTRSRRYHALIGKCSMPDPTAASFPGQYRRGTGGSRRALSRTARAPWPDPCGLGTNPATIEGGRCAGHDRDQEAWKTRRDLRVPPFRIYVGRATSRSGSGWTDGRVSTTSSPTLSSGSERPVRQRAAPRGAALDGIRAQCVKWGCRYIHSVRTRFCSARRRGRYFSELRLGNSWRHRRDDAARIKGNSAFGDRKVRRQFATRRLTRLRTLRIATSTRYAG